MHSWESFGLTLSIYTEAVEEGGGRCPVVVSGFNRAEIIGSGLKDVPLGRITPPFLMEGECVLCKSFYLDYLLLDYCRASTFMMRSRFESRFSPPYRVPWGGPIIVAKL